MKWFCYSRGIAAGGGDLVTSQNGGDHAHLVFKWDGGYPWEEVTDAIFDTESAGGHNHGGDTGDAGGHNHGLTLHNHGNPNNLDQGSAIGDHDHSISSDGSHTHKHKRAELITMEARKSAQSDDWWNVGIGVPPQDEDIWTWGNSGDHMHSLDIPSHTHDLQHGIFEGPTPTAVTVKVDGNIIPGLGTSETNIDIIPYLQKDGSGKIQRGWHEIEILPNNLGRIVANVVSQVFIQSRGGGDW